MNGARHVHARVASHLANMQASLTTPYAMNDKILIVDDEPQLSSMLADVLSDAGYEAQTADNGRDALDAVRRDPPDLMLLDVQMPKLDGFEVAARLKSDPATAAIPIIMLSAMEGRGARVIGLESGAEEYLSKPFDQAELLARIRNLLSLRESAKNTARTH
jgi:DNA-binding response OmpR family regulator